MDDAALEKIATWLADLYGENLLSLVMYGPAVHGNQPATPADVNLLAVVATLDATALERAAPALRWWRAEGYPPPVILSAAEQASSADVFPMEYLEIRERHRLLRGRDLFAATPRLPELHRLQVEHELRTHLVRLRGGYAAVCDDAKELERLMTGSVASFLGLIRHALVAVGEPLPRHRAETIAAAGTRFGIEAGPFTVLLEARTDKKLEDGKLPALRALFARYLAAIQQVERSLEEYHADAR